jgi:hypothetical protein
MCHERHIKTKARIRKENALAMHGTPPPSFRYTTFARKGFLLGSAPQ